MSELNQHSRVWFSPHGTEWEAETYEEALEMERDSLVEQLEALRVALADARDLAVAVADKNIGPLSERAREVQGAANDALGDLPMADEVAAICVGAKNHEDNHTWVVQ